MSVYNSISTLEKCLESIFSQSYREWHMFIVDDGSNDGSGFLLNKIKDKRVTILKNKVNRGLAYSLNKAIRLCDAELIARVDSDDIQHIDRLENQVIYMRENPKVDLLCSAAYIKNSKGCKKLIMPTSHKEISSRLKKSNCIIHPTIMVRANFFLNYGLYNETFRRAQDYELWLRALKKGARFGALNKPLIYYNTNNYAWPLKTLFRHSYNRLRIFFKYQDITSINSLIADLLHPYILKILSIFYFA